MIGVVVVLGLYDPRPLITRLEQSRRSKWWLIVSAAGTVIFVSPYLLAATSISPSSFAPLATCLLIQGATISVVGLLFWISDIEQLQGTLRARHLFFAIAIVSATFTASEWLDGLAWSVPAIQTATFNTTIFFLHLIGQTTVSEPESSVIGIDSFRVGVGTGCSGIVGILMVSGVVAVRHAAFGFCTAEGAGAIKDAAWLSNTPLPRSSGHLERPVRRPGTTLKSQGEFA
jgi:hypothetical protein